MVLCQRVCADNLRDYDANAMTFIQRLLCVTLALGLPWAGAQPVQPPDTPRNSALTAELLFEILVGEMQILQGESGAGYSLLLDAARKTGDEALYERAVEVALRSRAGDAALRAAVAWRQAAPQSRKANLRVLQIQVALQKLGDSLYALRQELSLAPEAELERLILSIPGFYNRAADKALAARVVEEALSDWQNKPKQGPLAWTVIGQMRLQASDLDGALKAAQTGHDMAPTRTEPFWLGLDLVQRHEPALKWVEGKIASIQDNALQQGWARALVGLGRLTQAEQVLLERLRLQAQDPSPWLLLGAIRLDMKQIDGAREAWERYLQATEPSAKTLVRERDQALLGLAQISLDQKQDAQAETWLNRVRGTDNQLRARTLRATIAGRQGQIEKGRMIIASQPVRTQKQERDRTLSEVQYLRQFKQWQTAYEVLSAAVARLDDDDDDELHYEWAMAADKIGKFTEMESILREIIERNPKFHHAYNALGYSLADRNVRLQEAKQLITKALEFAPDDAYITDSLGWVEFRLGRLPEAQAILRKAYDTKPDAEIAAHLGEVLWALGQKDQALEIWRQGLKLNADNETLQETLKRLGVRP